MAQQTAVDWLMDRFLFAGYGLPAEWREQAKQMEKKQVMNSYNDGYRDGMTDLNSNDKDISEFSNAKLYYDETYGKA